MDWKEYKAEHEKARFDPDFPKRVLEKAASMQECRKERIIMTRKTHIARRGLIAAILVLALCLSAFAAVYTNYDAIRNRLGIDKEDPIPQYVEYTDGNTNNNLTLISALRSDDSMNIYVEVSPIEHAYEGYTLEQANMAYMLDGVVSHGTSNITTVISYEEATKTALVEVRVMGFDCPLDDLTEVEITLKLSEGYAPAEAVYGPVTAPVTEADTLNAYFDLPFTTAVGQGHLTNAAVGTNTIVVSFDFPAYLTWDKAVPYDEEEAKKLSVEGDTEWGRQFTEAQHEYITAWLNGAMDMMEDARLEFADGTSVQITDMEPLLFNVWYPGPGHLSVYDFGNYNIVYMLAGTLDLRTVTGITIAGVTYPLMTAE